jgi:integrase
MIKRYIYQRGSKYYFRKRVPSDLKYLFRKDYVHRALYTGILSDAEQRATYFILQFERVFSILRSSYLSILEKNLVLNRLLNEHPYAEPYEQGINFVFKNQGKCIKYYESAKYRGLNMEREGHEYQNVLIKAIDDLWNFFSVEWEFLPVKAKDGFIDDFKKNSVFINTINRVVAEHLHKFVKLCHSSWPPETDVDSIIDSIESCYPEIINHEAKTAIVSGQIASILVQMDKDSGDNIIVSTRLITSLYAFLLNDFKPVFDSILKKYVKISWTALYTEKSLDYLISNVEIETLPGMVEVLQSATVFGFGKDYKLRLQEYLQINFSGMDDYFRSSVQNAITSVESIVITKALRLLGQSANPKSVVFMKREVASVSVLEEYTDKKKKLITAQIEVDPSLVAKIYSILNEALAKCSSIHIEKTGEIPSYTIGKEKFVSNISQERKVSEMPLSKLIKKFIRFKNAQKKLSAKLQKELPPIMELLTELLEEVDYRRMTIEDGLEKVFIPIQNFPTYRKVRYKGKTALEILAMKYDRNRKCFAPKTVNKYMYWYSAMFDFAVKHNYLKFNPFLGLMVDEDSSPEEEKDPFSDEDIIRIFSCPLYNQANYPKEFEKIHKYGPHRYWTAIIGLYNGMRLSEICSLRTSDFITEMDINCIKVNKKQKGKRVKSSAGFRIVPIHPFLEKIGLLKYVDELREKGQIRLFPECEEHPIMGSGHAYSSFFGRIKEKYLEPFFNEGDNKSFHSFRHNFSRAIRYNDGDIITVDIITGHVGPLKTESLRYSSNYSTKWLYETIMKVKYNFDLYQMLKDQNALPECVDSEKSSDNIAIAIPKVTEE